MRISLAQAISLLQSGQVVAVPTETVYGLAASLAHPQAIEHLFALKKRPLANPLIIHVASWADIDTYAPYYPPGFAALANAFWPGPLTCILPVHPTVPELVRAGRPTAAFRVPGAWLARQLLAAVGPLAMPSANLSGRPSATHPKHVEEDFGSNFPVLEGGACSGGIESTVVLYQEPEWVIVRLGILTAAQFAPLLGYSPRFLQNPSNTPPVCPGQAFRHYAPRALLSLAPCPGEAPFILGFAERVYPAHRRLIVLGSLQHPAEVAANLYQALRQLDEEGAAQAWVDMNFPREGLWQVIAERLRRAAELPS